MAEFFEVAACEEKIFKIPFQTASVCSRMMLLHQSLVGLADSPTNTFEQGGRVTRLGFGHKLSR